MPVARTAFNIETGTPKYWERTAASGRVVACASCPECGTRLFHAPARNTEIVNVKPGTLNNTNWLSPVAHVWLRSAQPWVIIPEDVLRYDAQPESFDAIFKVWEEKCEQVKA